MILQVDKQGLQPCRLIRVLGLWNPTRNFSRVLQLWTPLSKQFSNDVWCARQTRSEMEGDVIFINILHQNLQAPPTRVRSTQSKVFWVSFHSARTKVLEAEVRVHLCRGLLGRQKQAWVCFVLCFGLFYLLWPLSLSFLLRVTMICISFICVYKCLQLLELDFVCLVKVTGKRMHALSRETTLASLHLFLYWI